MMDTDGGPSTIQEADDLLTTNAPEETPEPAAAEPAALAPGQPRDEAGRFTSPPQAEPEAAQADAAPAPETGEPVAAATEEVVGESQPEEPFRYRADGQEFTIPGSDTGADGIFIPASHVPEVQQLLAAGRATFGSVRQRLSEAAQQVTAANERIKAVEAEKQQVLSHIEGLIESGQIGDWLANVQQNWPILKAEAARKGLELQGAAERAELQRYKDQESQARLRPLMQQTLQRTVQEFGQAAGLDGTAMQAVQQQLADPTFESVLFVKAPYDDPASGLKQGELAINRAIVQRAIGLASVGRSAPAGQQKIAEAQRQNQQAAVKVPPTVGKGSQPAKRAIPQPKTTKEADDLLLEGDLDWAAEV